MNSRNYSSNGILQIVVEVTTNMDIVYTFLCDSKSDALADIWMMKINKSKEERTSVSGVWFMVSFYDH